MNHGPRTTIKGLGDFGDRKTTDHGFIIKNLGEPGDTRTTDHGSPLKTSENMATDGPRTTHHGP